jgi:hypothetical protein
MSRTKPNHKTFNACGEDNGKAKLTARKVVRIRALHGTGLISLSELGRVFDVHHSCVAKVCTRAAWAHIP